MFIVLSLEKFKTALGRNVCRLWQVGFPKKLSLRQRLACKRLTKGGLLQWAPVKGMGRKKKWEGRERSEAMMKSQGEPKLSLQPICKVTWPFRADPSWGKRSSLHATPMLSSRQIRVPSGRGQNLGEYYHFSLKLSISSTRALPGRPTTQAKLAVLSAAPHLGSVLVAVPPHGLHTKLFHVSFL